MSSVPPEEGRSQLHFPAPWRVRAWASSSSDVFDVIVVGGGITGAGIARDAALRGLRVAVFDRGDFGRGTSSRSSRLVHGGVRYLEHGHLHLVLESSRERRRLLRIAPHLVRPLAFTWPVYAGARIRRWKLSAGLSLYDALSLFRNVAPHRRLSPDEVLRDEPNLRADALRGGARYYDAAADDARLVLANVVAAVEQGAVALNYASVERVGARREGTGAWVVDVQDMLSDATHRFHSRSVVFALGPWSDDVPRLIGQQAPRTAVLPSLGAHIALDRRRVGNVGALTLLAPVDGRVFFVLPARDLTIATTTESPVHAPPQDARVGRSDVHYLLAAVNHYFPQAHQHADNVIAAWAGVRPLAAPPPNVKGQLTSASREHSITEAQPGLFVVTGGKLTTYRAMAEEVVDRLAATLLPRFRRAVTHRVPLPGGELHDVRSAIEALCLIVGDQAVAERLVFAYGARWPRVLDRAEPAEMMRLAPDSPYLLSEVTHAIEQEFAVTLADVLIRRIPLAFEQPDHAVATATALAATLAERFGWSAAEITALLRDYEAAVERQFAVE